MTPLLAVGASWAGAAAVGVARRRPVVAWAAAVAASGATLAFTARAAWTGAVVEAPWVPSWGAELLLDADPLGSLLAVLAAAVGALVVVYARPYMAHHLEEHDRPPREEARFHALMLLFLGTMVGLAYARDLLLVFVFFDLSAVWSYLLIGFDRERPEARVGALTAVIVTGAGSVALLAAALVWHAAAGTFDVAGLGAAAMPDGSRELGAGLVLVAALAKSAQVPLHFWLPRAMAAPTPVSAYLHSAAMVAAGIFVLLRLEPVMAGTAAAAALPWLGLSSIVVGSVLALGADPLKQLLAYSTVAQYGYMLLLLGLGGDAGVAGAALYLVVHGVAKSALFMTAGAVQQATGVDRLSEVPDGLFRRMPLLALASLVSAAALAGLPFTAGYFKDEALFKAALESGPLFGAVAMLAVGLTVAYTARFWVGTFVGGAVRPPHREGDGKDPEVETPSPGLAGAAAEEERARDRPDEPSIGLVGPVIVLAAVAAAGGVLPELLARLASAAGGSAAGRPVELHLAYEIGTPLYLAAGAYALGVALYLSRHSWWPLVARAHRLGVELGAEAIYEAGLAGLNRLSSRVHALEVRDLRDRLASIMLPACLLVALALGTAYGRTEWLVGPLDVGHAPLVVALTALTVAGLGTPGRRSHLTLVLALSAVGYTLAAVYALLGAPDLALVAVLVETVFTIFLLGAFGAVPRNVLRREEVRQGRTRTQERRHRAAGAVGGGIAFVVTWAALSVQEAGGVAAVHEAESGKVHAEDPVSAILSDFRGLDTAGEITVLALALLGLHLLLGRRGS